LKKRSGIEDEHAKELKKLVRIADDNIRSPAARQGSYAASFERVNKIHNSMADNGAQFAISLHQMHEDLNDLAHNMDRGRKQWKQQGLSAEQKVQDAEAQMEKARAKYDKLAEDYDGVRTGDKSVRHFGLRGPKSAQQQEENLLGKVQAADSDYSSKVQNAKSLREELLSTLRPDAIKAVQVLIDECDSALSLQLQKYASFNEKLLLGNGVLISPRKEESGTGANSLSMRDMV